MKLVVSSGRIHISSTGEVTAHDAKVALSITDDHSVMKIQAKPLHPSFHFHHTSVSDTDRPPDKDKCWKESETIPDHTYISGLCVTDGAHLRCCLRAEFFAFTLLEISVVCRASLSFHSIIPGGPEQISLSAKNFATVSLSGTVHHFNARMNDDASLFAHNLRCVQTLNVAVLERAIALCGFLDSCAVITSRKNKGAVVATNLEDPLQIPVPEIYDCKESAERGTEGNPEHDNYWKCTTCARYILLCDAAACAERLQSKDNYKCPHCWGPGPVDDARSNHSLFI